MDAIFERLERLEIASQEDYMYFVDVSNRVLDPAQPILILGETPLRRLGIPLAALRGSSDGIWATSIAHHQFTPQSLDEAIVSCHRRCLLNMGLFYTNNMHWEYVDFDSKYTDLRRVLRTPRSEDLVCRFSATADPTNISRFLADYASHRPPTSIIWCQHTWINNNYNTRRSSGTKTGDRRFLSRCVFSAARVQRPGDIFLVGIEKSRRMSRYDVEEGVEELMHTARNAGYRSLGEDTRLKRALMNYGHQPNGTAGEGRSSDDNVEDWMLGSSITHVFVKERGITQPFVPLDRSHAYVSNSRPSNVKNARYADSPTRLTYRDKNDVDNDDDDDDDDDDGDDDDQDQYAIDTPNYSHRRHASRSDRVPESDYTETASTTSSSEETSTTGSDVMTVTAPRDWTWTRSDYWLDLQPDNPSESPFDDDDSDDDGDDTQATPARGIEDHPQYTRNRSNPSTILSPGMGTANLRQYDAYPNEDPDVGGYDEDVLDSYWEE